MFCANTSPVPVESTDFGEMSPVIVFSRTSGRSTAGGSGVVVVVDREVVVRGGFAAVAGVLGDVDADTRPVEEVDAEAERALE